jgi:hypothetical protein
MFKMILIGVVIKILDRPAVIFRVSKKGLQILELGQRTHPPTGKVLDPPA